MIQLSRNNYLLRSPVGGRITRACPSFIGGLPPANPTRVGMIFNPQLGGYLMNHSTYPRASRVNQDAHLIEQPMLGIWFLGPWPVSAMRRMALTKSALRPVASPVLHHPDVRDIEARLGY